MNLVSEGNLAPSNQLTPLIQIFVFLCDVTLFFESSFQMSVKSDGLSENLRHMLSQSRCVALLYLVGAL